MTTFDLDKPTVADLIRVLQSMPANASVAIEDADTGWTMRRIHIGLNESKYGPQANDPPNRVWLWAEYFETDSHER